MNKKFGIIGNERMTLRCLRYMLEQPGIEVGFVIYDPGKENGGLADFCSKHAVPCYGTSRLHTPENLEMIRAYQPDMILSISNYWVMKKELLDIPENGVLNFHNGPPSNYRGIYVPSWVILNGETRHGVMWHFAEENVDSGDVIGSRMFDVAEDETAATLMVKCISQGIELFRELFGKIVSASYSRFPQTGDALHYTKKHRPENEGILDFTWSKTKLRRMARALNYLPFPNPFCYARLKTTAGEVIVNELYEAAGMAGELPCGQVVKAMADEFLVACSDGVIGIAAAMDASWNEYEPGDLPGILGVKEGDILKPILSQA